MIFDHGLADDVLRQLRRTRPTIEDLSKEVGGLSAPGKMPCYGYSLPAAHCKMGNQLRWVPGSVCSDCYAMKGRYKFPNVVHALQLRYDIIQQNVTSWAAHMVALLERKNKGNIAYFRWHDSGDLIDGDHLEAIMWIAEKLPHVAFWLPTKEYKLVHEYFFLLKGIENLTVRVSAPMVGQKMGSYFPTSSVDSGVGYRCPAPQQEGKCGNCRACWTKGEKNVDYHKH